MTFYVTNYEAMPIRHVRDEVILQYRLLVIKYRSLYDLLVCL